MYVNPFQLSLETLIGVAPMLGHRLEDRARVREAQDHWLVRALQTCTTANLAERAQRELFCVAPLDLLVYEENGRKKFHLLEINGTGIGGLTNISAEAVSSVLEGFAEMAQANDDPESLVLVAASGKESETSPRLNKLLHEKVLYVEALRRGFELGGQTPLVDTLPALVRDASPLGHRRPAVVLGYIKEFLDHLRLEPDGRLTLFGRPVTAAINDRFCLNILQRFGAGVDLERLQTMNRCFQAGADKAVAHELCNDFLELHPCRHFAARVDFARAETRADLIATVLSWLRRGRRAVIKPAGTGLGHGIEFFLRADEPVPDVVARIDNSLQFTERHYGLPGGALPYTVCDFIDGCTIDAPNHALHGHKYELRIVVYREKDMLKAFPSIVKIASEAYRADRPDPLSLINNITASAVATNTDGIDHMLPLANRDTLALLGLRLEHLKELCSFSTRFVRHVLDRTVEAPARLGLPGDCHLSPHASLRACGVSSDPAGSKTRLRAWAPLSD